MFDQTPQSSTPGDLPTSNNQPPAPSAPTSEGQANESALPTIADIAAAKDGKQGSAPVQSQAPVASTPPVEDIFAKTDQAGGSNVSRPIQPGGASNMPNDPVSENMLYSNKPTWLKKVMMAVIALVVVAIVVAAGWWAFNYFSTQRDNSNDNSELAGNDNTNAGDSQNTDANNNANTNSGQTEIVPPDNQNTVVPPADTDSDGLSDTREIELGTDISNVDTDQDGLSDWAEVNVYSTDPLNPDTDGDSYLDGNEVINNYDPNRPGSSRLYNIP